MTNATPTRREEEGEKCPRRGRTLVNRLRIARVFLARMSSGSFLPLYSSRRLARVLWLMTVRTRAIDLRTVELFGESEEVGSVFLSLPSWRCAPPPSPPLGWFCCSKPIHRRPSKPTQAPAPAAQQQQQHAPFRALSIHRRVVGDACRRGAKRGSLASRFERVVGFERSVLRVSLPPVRVGPRRLFERRRGDGWRHIGLDSFGRVVRWCCCCLVLLVLSPPLADCAPLLRFAPAAFGSPEHSGIRCLCRLPCNPSLRVPRGLPGPLPPN